MHLPRLTMTNICKSAPKFILVSFFFYIFVPIMRKILFIAINSTDMRQTVRTEHVIQPIRKFGIRYRPRYVRPERNPIDTTAVNDASTIPIGLTSWKIDARFGNRTEVPVDTLQHGFQNTNDTGGPLRTLYLFWGTWELPVLLMYFSTVKMQPVLLFRPLRLHCVTTARRNIHKHQVALCQLDLL